MKVLALLVSTAAIALALPHGDPADLVARDSAETEGPLLYPWATFRYWVASGRLVEDPQDQLLVVKDGTGDGETTAIVTFDVTADLAGRTCRLLFDLWDRDVSTGSQEVDVFTVVSPPGTSTAAGSAFAVAAAVQSRDRHVGRIHVTAPGVADWIMSFDGFPDFPCPAGQVVGIEFVGVGDAITLRWDIGVTGPRVQVL